MPASTSASTTRAAGVARQSWRWRRASGPRANCSAPVVGRSPATDAEKRAAAWAAAQLIRPGMTVGLGSGSTVAGLVEVLAHARPDACFVAASPATAAAANQHGLPLLALD